MASWPLVARPPEIAVSAADPGVDDVGGDAGATGVVDVRAVQRQVRQVDPVQTLGRSGVRVSVIVYCWSACTEATAGPFRQVPTASGQRGTQVPG